MATTPTTLTARCGGHSQRNKVVHKHTGGRGKVNRLRVLNCFHSSTLVIILCFFAYGTFGMLEVRSQSQLTIDTGRFLRGMRATCISKQPYVS